MRHPEKGGGCLAISSPLILLKGGGFVNKSINIYLAVFWVTAKIGVFTGHCLLSAPVTGTNRSRFPTS